MNNNKPMFGGQQMASPQSSKPQQGGQTMPGALGQTQGALNSSGKPATGYQPPQPSPQLFQPANSGSQMTIPSQSVVNVPKPLQTPQQGVSNMPRVNPVGKSPAQVQQDTRAISPTGQLDPAHAFAQAQAQGWKPPSNGTQTPYTTWLQQNPQYASQSASYNKTAAPAQTTQLNQQTANQMQANAPPGMYWTGQFQSNTGTPVYSDRPVGSLNTGQQNDPAYQRWLATALGGNR